MRKKAENWLEQSEWRDGCGVIWELLTGLYLEHASGECGGQEGRQLHLVRVVGRRVGSCIW